ncbi:CpaF family protein [Neomoorella mulderi]|uniref:Putative conjugal transfer proteinc n=1 Tax=Moorella mulderi DSM 14980 TaxID=1122241 RepID=A0A151ASP1_9FIRM|nr:ATPase, T2SS/T4P/T4SS family [Moorella mulderi]KYH30625.1 putative conjugal transfer proteinc [Moorella mulderi DSM 14980]
MANWEATLEPDMLEKVRYRAIQRIRRENREVLRRPEGHRDYLQRVFREELERVRPDMSIGQLRELARGLALDVMGYGPLYDLLRDSKITEIQVFAPDKVLVEREGEITEARVRFRDMDHLLNITRGLVGVAGARLDENSPLVTCQLPDGSRLTASIAPVELNGVFLGIRKFPEFLDLEELVRRGTLTAAAAAFLKLAVDIGLNIAVTGPVGVGKTTLMNALADLIPLGKTLATTEEVAELQFPRRRNVRRLVAKFPNVEGTGEISLPVLLKAQLRHQHDWDIIGECRAAEAYYVLTATTAGHSIMTTFHAETPREAVTMRFPDMVLQSAEGRAYGDSRAIEHKVALSLDVVVQMARAGRERKVVEIAAVGWDKGVVIEPLFCLEGDKLVSAGGRGLELLRAKRPYRNWKAVD